MAGESVGTRSVGMVAIVVLVMLSVGTAWLMFGDDWGRDRNDIHIKVPGGK